MLRQDIKNKRSEMKEIGRGGGEELLNQLFKSRVFTVLPTRYRMNWSQMELIRSNELVV